jgi:hypothetical protein
MVEGRQVLERRIGSRGSGHRTNRIFLVFEGRYTGNLDAVLPAVRRAIHDVDPNLPISNVTTLEV